MKRTTGGLGAVVAAVALGGCYTYTPVTVAVRDRATRAPIADADVRVSNTSLNPLGPKADTGVTDDAGKVVVKVAAYNRLLVRVSAPGHADHLVVADHPAVIGDTGWLHPATNERGDRASVEVRLTP